MLESIYIHWKLFAKLFHYRCMIGGICYNFFCIELKDDLACVEQFPIYKIEYKNCNYKKLQKLALEFTLVL